MSGWKIYAIGGHDGLAVLEHEPCGTHLQRARRGVAGEKFIEHEHYDWLMIDEDAKIAVAYRRRPKELPVKTPVRLKELKTNGMGFCTGQIVDADGNTVFSGVIRDQETALRIITCLNDHDALIAARRHYAELATDLEDRQEDP